MDISFFMRTAMQKDCIVGAAKLCTFACVNTKLYRIKDIAASGRKGRNYGISKEKYTKKADEKTKK